MKKLLALFGQLSIYAIRCYQLMISPLLPPTCRYHPSCSSYGLKAIERWGLAKGALLAVARLLRCNPWSAGGLDPVPDRTEGVPPQ